MLSVGHVRSCTQVHQSQLETVLPKPGGSVMVLSGRHAGNRGTLLAIDEHKFQAQVGSHIMLSSGLCRVLMSLDAEDVPMFRVAC